MHGRGLVLGGRLGRSSLVSRGLGRRVRLLVRLRGGVLRLGGGLDGVLGGSHLESGRDLGGLGGLVGRQLGLQDGHLRLELLLLRLLHLLNRGGGRRRVLHLLDKGGGRVHDGAAHSSQVLLGLGDRVRGVRRLVGRRVDNNNRRRGSRIVIHEELRHRQVVHLGLLHGLLLLLHGCGGVLALGERGDRLVRRRGRRRGRQGRRRRSGEMSRNTHGQPGGLRDLGLVGGRGGVGRGLVRGGVRGDEVRGVRRSRRLRLGSLGGDHLDGSLDGRRRHHGGGGGRHLGGRLGRGLRGRRGLLRGLLLEQGLRHGRHLLRGRRRDLGDGSGRLGRLRDRLRLRLLRRGSDERLRDRLLRRRSDDRLGDRLGDRLLRRRGDDRLRDDRLLLRLHHGLLLQGARGVDRGLDCRLDRSRDRSRGLLGRRGDDRSRGLDCRLDRSRGGRGDGGGLDGLRRGGGGLCGRHGRRLRVAAEEALDRVRQDVHAGVILASGLRLDELLRLLRLHLVMGVPHRLGRICVEHQEEQEETIDPLGHHCLGNHLPGGKVWLREA
mmetsp:Transcript_98086/g.211532  ORF Transcript_98086/g.211532 Transcript_98086/m.211532 type:complete len:549 (+) Transcript_98086:1122-2768(+)